MVYDRWHRYKTESGNFVKTQDQLREYVSSKNQISRKMLDLFDELLEGKKVYFRVNPKNAILNEKGPHNVHEYESKTIIPLPSLLKKKHLYPKSLRPGLMIGVSKPRYITKRIKSDIDTVYIDTGYVKITEKGEVLRSARGWRFDWNRLEGLKNVKLEAERAINIYEKIFLYE